MKLEAIKNRIRKLGHGTEEAAFFNIHLSKKESIVAFCSEDSLVLTNDYNSYSLHTFSEKIYLYEKGQYSVEWITTGGGETNRQMLEYTEDEFWTEIEKLISIAEIEGEYALDKAS